MLNITSIEDRTGRGTYVGGESFDVRVNYANAGDSTAQGVDGILVFGGYGSMSASDPAPVNVSAFSTAYQDFTISISAGAASAAVTIDCIATGIDEATNSSIVVESYDNDLDVAIQKQANIAITGFVDLTGQPGYNAGESFDLLVTFSNTGGTDGTVDAALDDGAFTFLTFGSPDPVIVPSGGTANQTFQVNVSSGAPQAAVTIAATWTGTEAISGRSISGDAPPDTKSVQIGYPPAVTITGLSVSGGGTYVGGMSFSLTVTFSNTGALNASVDATLDDGAYTRLIWNNPVAVTVPAGGSQTQTFTVTCSGSATTATVTIAATWTGTLIGPGTSISGDIPTDTINVNVQSQSAVSITSLAIGSPRPAPGPYIGGETLSLVVYFANSGGTGATVDATIDDGLYTGLTLTANPAAIALNAGSTNMQIFSIPILASAPEGNVTISAWWTGTEFISGRAISGDMPVDTIQITIGCSHVSITGLAIAGISGAGPYVGGMTFTLNVTFQNPGVIGATVDATLDDGAYTGLTFSNPSAIPLPAGSTRYQVFTVTALPGAGTAAVTITAAWTGTESVSGRAISGDSPVDTIPVSMQSQAFVAITAVSITSPRAAPGPYDHDEVLNLRVTFSNMGGTAATVDATIDDGAYTGLSWNDPAAVVVGAGSTATQNFTVTVASLASYAAVMITAMWTGTEAISNRSISGDVPADILALNIQDVGHDVSIIALSFTAPRVAPGPYIGGETLTLRITFSNTGGTAATVDAAIDDGTYTGLSWNDPAAVVVAAAGTQTQNFAVTVAANASTSAVTITATWNGTEQGTGDPLSGDAPADTIAINIQAQAVINIIDMSIVTLRPAPGPYVGGETFKLQITMANTGGTSAFARPTIDDGPYTGLTFDGPPGATVNPGGTATHNRTITVMAGATTATVNITAVWTGTESISGRAMSGDLPPYDVITINIQRQANLAISAMAVVAPRPAPGPYFGGEDAVLRVTFTNTGGTAATVDATIDDGAYTGLTFANNPAPVTVNAGGGTATQDFTISVNVTAPMQYGVVVTATWNGTEAYSARALSGDTPADTISIDINIWITFSVSQTILGGRSTYVHGESFVVRVTIDNSAGAVAITGGTLVIDLGGAAGFSANTTTVPSPIEIGQVVTRDFLVQTTAGAAVSCNMQTRLTTTSPAADIYSPIIVISTVAPAVVSITAMAIMAPRPAPGPYIGGETFTLRVTFTNTAAAGSASAWVDATVEAGTYSGLTFSDPAAVLVTTSNIQWQTFTVSSAAGAETAVVTLTATWTGTMQYSGAPMSGDTPADTITINMQSQAVVAITGLSITAPRAAPGPYVGGESFTLLVTFSNTGGTAATVDATLDDGPYDGLSLPNPAPVSVAANDTQTQSHAIGVLAGAATASVTIIVTWTGTETTSGRAISGDTPADTIIVSVQAQAHVTITTIEITAPRAVPGPYIGGETITLRVTFTNTGGTAATVDAVPDDGPYTGIFLGYSPAPVLVAAAGGTNYQDFNFPILDSASTAVVNITVGWMGTELISLRAISGVNSTIVNIKAQATLTITGAPMFLSGNGTYVAGTTFIVRVSLSNPAASARALAVTASLAGLVAGATTNASASKTISGAGYIDFLITIAAGTASQALSITASVSGIEEISARVLTAGPSSALNVNIKAQAALTITGAPTYQTGNGTYVAGTTLVIRVSLNNPTTSAKARTVTVALAGLVAGVTANGSASKTISGAGYVDFLLTFAAGMATQTLTITATASGSEEITARPLSAGPSSAMIIWIKAQANLTITGFTWKTGNGTYTAGTVFVVRVSLSNPATSAKAVTVAAALTFGGATGISANASASKTISGNGFIDLLITIAAGAPSQPIVTITTTVTGTEEYSNRALGPLTSTLNITIQSQANIVIDTLATNASITRPGRWIMAVVNIRNTGGAAVNLGTITLTFTGNGSSYAGSQAAVNVTMGSLFIPGNGRLGAQIQFYVSPAAVNESVIWVNATFSGTEAISGAARNTPAAITPAMVTVMITPVIFTIMVVGGRTTFIRGIDSFVVCATIDNSQGTTPITSASIALSFGVAVNYNVNTTYTGQTIAASAVATYSFLVTVTATATLGSVNVLGILNGINPDTLTKTSQVAITTYKPSNVVLTSVTRLTGNGTYVGGQTFVVRVMFTNAGAGAGGLGVSASLNYNGATGLSSNGSSVKTIPANVTTAIDFLVSVAAGVASQPSVTIGATWTGTEQYSGRVIGGSSGTNSVVAIKAQANLQISGITFQTGNATYVAGMTFKVRVSMSNPATSAKALFVTATLNFGGASGLSANASALKTISGAGYIDFLITVAAGTASQVISITATASGSEEITARALIAGPSSALNINIKAQATLAITGFTWKTGNGTYIAGTMFVVRVSLFNPAASARALIVTAPMSFGNATGLSTNTSASRTISGVGFSDLLIIIAAAAPSQPSVTITTTVTGTEEISGRALGPLTSTLVITIKAQALVEITSLAITSPRAAPGPYFAGEILALWVTFSNTRSKAATVDATLDDGAYFGLSFDDPAAVTVNAGGMASQCHVITVWFAAATASVTITVTWNGTELETGDPLSGDSPADTIDVNIQTHSWVTITSMAIIAPRLAPGPYVGGESFTLRVMFTNTGGTAATADATLDDDTYTGLIFGNPAPVVVGVGGTTAQDHAITAVAGAVTAAVTIWASWNGTEQGTGDPFSGYVPSNNITINIQQQANLAIIGIDDMTGTAPYWHGGSFVVRVTYQNTGGTDAQLVDGTLGFGNYTFLSVTNPLAISVPAGSTAYQEFTVVVSWIATSAMVEVTATATGQESFTGRSLSNSTAGYTSLQLQIDGAWDINISIGLDLGLNQIPVNAVIHWVPIIICQNLTIIGYAWDFGDGMASTVQNPTHTYTEVGDYIVTLTITFNNGMSMAKTMAITVTQEQDPTIIYVIIIVIVIGSVAVVSAFSYKRFVVQKKKAAKSLGTKSSKHSPQLTRYVEPASVEPTHPGEGTPEPAPRSTAAGQETRVGEGPGAVGVARGSSPPATGNERGVRVLVPDVVDFINKLQVPDDVKGEIFGIIKDMPPGEQRVYLASIFAREWETDEE